MDAAADRAHADFVAAIEATRSGYLFAHDVGLYRSWLRREKRSASLSGTALEAAVTALAFTHPEYIVAGPR